MPDVYATITQADEAVQEQLASVLELLAADPQQIAMREAYLAQVRFVPGARVLEVGAGQEASLAPLRPPHASGRSSGSTLRPSFSSGRARWPRV
jgi:hypothetical protein